jgi:radical SAM superfamily enzyme YgiQ (UPF0313 family)
MNILFVVNATHHWERLGILSLSSDLKCRGHQVLLLDVRGKSEQAILRSVAKTDADVLAYSAMSNEIGGLIRVNQLIRRNLQRGIKSVFGGPHPTFVPELIKQESVDALCRGDAEESFPHYLEYLATTRSPDQISGFLVRHRGEVVENPIRTRISDLDSLPFPDRRLWDAVDPRPVQKSFFGSRGCPYQCAFCFNHAYNELYGHPHPVVRRRGAESLVCEIRQVLNLYPDAHPFFDDDSFLTAPLEWLEEFAGRYRRDIGRPFGCNVRADQVTERSIRLLADAGWQYCWFGVECGNETFANGIMHRGLTNEQILKAAGLLRSHGIWFATQNINALPTDHPLETDEQTLQLNLKCKPDFAMAHVFFPFPGTPLARYSSEKGLFDGDNSRLNDPICLSSPLLFDRKLKRELERQNRLFGPVVALPWLGPLLPILRRLPLGGLYALAHFLCVGYCTRMKLAPVRKGLRNYRALIALLFRRLARVR